MADQGVQVLLSRVRIGGADDDQDPRQIKLWYVSLMYWDGYDSFRLLINSRTS